MQLPSTVEKRSLTGTLLTVLFSWFKGKKITTKPGDQWLDVNALEPATGRRSRLSAAQINRVRRIQAALAEVDPSSVEMWICDFEKDRHPEKEISLWEATSDAYQLYCSTRSLDTEQKRDVFRILLIRSRTDDEGAVLSHVELRLLTAKDARDVMKCFKGAATPVVVVPKLP
ncbi:MAG: hypothetical protein ABSA78_12605 [Candidatus Sulfotelmatobacter sp.]|jgi:hypothetical protein